MRLWLSLSLGEKALVALFLLTLSFAQPRLQADGIGYYAYARSILIDHNLEFKGDWRPPNFGDVDIAGYINGRPILTHYTKTGHRANHFAVGPAMLWFPFLAVTHGVVLAVDELGAMIPADGHSRPYLVTMACATALYGFLGLWLSFRLARNYFKEPEAFLATIGIWLASSLPAYMYAQPSWAHAQSVFACSLFLWYWHRTMGTRTNLQWLVLGAIAGLMIEVYYASFVFLLAPAIEIVLLLTTAWRKPAERWAAVLRIVRRGLLFAGCAFLVFVPTLITRQVIYGSPLSVGLYTEKGWNWSHPAFWQILFSSQRGLVVWTPILVPASCGLLCLRRRDAKFAGILLAITGAFYLLIALDPWWDGVASFGNRYFVTLTPVFVLGLSGALAWFIGQWKAQNAGLRRAVAILVVLIVWNLGLVYQWGTGLLPNTGPISWEEVVYNQFRVVPGQLLGSLRVESTKANGIR